MKKFIFLVPLLVVTNFFSGCAVTGELAKLNRTAEAGANLSAFGRNFSLVGPELRETEAQMRALGDPAADAAAALVEAMSEMAYAARNSAKKINNGGVK